MERYEREDLYNILRVDAEMVNNKLSHDLEELDDKIKDVNMACDILSDFIHYTQKQHKNIEYIDTLLTDIDEDGGCYVSKLGEEMGKKLHGEINSKIIVYLNKYKQFSYPVNELLNYNINYLESIEYPNKED